MSMLFDLTFQIAKILFNVNTKGFYQLNICIYFTRAVEQILSDADSDLIYNPTSLV